MLKRILVGLGGTDYTVTAINQAVALAMAHDAEVTGVSIIDESRLTYSGLSRLVVGIMLTNSPTTAWKRRRSVASGPCRSLPRRAERPACGIDCCAKWANRSR